jgi:hypothetical protein
MACGCGFKMSIGKFIEATKGKKAEAYRLAVARNIKIDKFKAKSKIRYRKAELTQNKEREDNLKRMRAKGII